VPGKAGNPRIRGGNNEKIRGERNNGAGRDTPHSKAGGKGQRNLHLVKRLLVTKRGPGQGDDLKKNRPAKHPSSLLLASGAAAAERGKPRRSQTTRETRGGGKRQTH